MPETSVRYAVYWGGKTLGNRFGTPDAAAMFIAHRRSAAALDPTSMFFEALPEGEPRIMRQAVTYSDWEDDIDAPGTRDPHCTRMSCAGGEDWAKFSALHPIVSIGGRSLHPGTIGD